MGLHRPLQCAVFAAMQELVQHHQADTAELKRLEAMFKNTTSVVWQIWGPEACR